MQQPKIKSISFASTDTGMEPSYRHLRILYDISQYLNLTNATIPVKDATGQLLTVPNGQLKSWIQ